MEMGNLEITIKGDPISPKKLDIQDAQFLLSSMDDLLFPEKKPREKAYVEFQDGSLKIILVTTLIYVTSFNQNILTLEKNSSLNNLPKSFQIAMEKLQHFVLQNRYEIYMKTSLKGSPTITIDSATKYFISKQILVDVELYLYGQIIDAGGKDKANIHLSTKEYGVVTISTSIDYLAHQKKNLLYKQYSAHVFAKQVLQTGEIEPNTYKLVELVEFNPLYDKEYISAKIKKASKWMSKYEPDELLGIMRGKA